MRGFFSVLFGTCADLTWGFFFFFNPVQLIFSDMSSLREHQRAAYWTCHSTPISLLDASISLSAFWCLPSDPSLSSVIYSWAASHLLCNPFTELFTSSDLFHSAIFFSVLFQVILFYNHLLKQGFWSFVSVFKHRDRHVFPMAVPVSVLGPHIVLSIVSADSCFLCYIIFLLQVRFFSLVWLARVHLFMLVSQL